MLNDWCEHCGGKDPQPCVVLAGSSICIHCVEEAAEELGLIEAEEVATENPS